MNHYMCPTKWGLHFSFLSCHGLRNMPISLRKVQYESVYYNQCYWEVISVFGMQVPALVYACSFLASIVLQVYLSAFFCHPLHMPFEFERCRSSLMSVQSGTMLIIIEVVDWFAVCLGTLSGTTLDKFSAKACVRSGSGPVGVIRRRLPSSSPESARHHLPPRSSHWHRKCFYAGVYLSTTHCTFLLFFPLHWLISTACCRGCISGLDD